MREYALKFMMLSKYAPSLVVDSYTQISKFNLGVYDLVVKECHTAMLVKEMDISRLITYVKQIKSENLKE